MKTIILQENDFKNDGMGYSWKDLLNQFGLSENTEIVTLKINDVEGE